MVGISMRFDTHCAGSSVSWLRIATPDTGCNSVIDRNCSDQKWNSVGVSGLGKI